VSSLTSLGNGLKVDVSWQDEAKNKIGIAHIKSGNFCRQLIDFAVRVTRL
jgi:hypothetical protein